MICSVGPMVGLRQGVATRPANSRSVVGVDSLHHPLYECLSDLVLSTTFKAGGFGEWSNQTFWVTDWLNGYIGYKAAD